MAAIFDVLRDCRGGCRGDCGAKCVLKGNSGCDIISSQLNGAAVPRLAVRTAK